MRVLLTGGAGYIGSHTALEIQNSGGEVIVLDNFSNSSPESLKRVESLSGKKITVIEGDLCSSSLVDQVFSNEKIDAVVHFAGLKAVGESVSQPLVYYRTNLTATFNLLESMQKSSVQKLVFSSSATVYGDPERIPIDESCAVNDAANPYGRSKLMIERILEDFQIANPDFDIVRLRYFNPAGAHRSGQIGEDPLGVPNNLLPFVSQFAVGKHKELVVNGNDYATSDGTCIRDYIHVTDLALGHLAALHKLENKPGLVTYNLGSGRGYSVLEVIQAFGRASGINLEYRIGNRRQGDIPESYTDPALAKSDLGWQSTLGIDEICRDAWNWQRNNPNGFR